MSALNRRRFMKLLASSAMAAPWLTGLGARAYAETSTPPKRCIFVFTPCGVEADARIQDLGTNGAAFTLGPGLAPLQPHAQALTVLEGLHLSTAFTGPGDAHQLGIGQLLTGVPLLPGTLFSPFDDGNMSVGWGGGISLDQVLADALGDQTWLRSLHLGVQTRYSPVLTVSSALSYRGPNAPVAADDDPAQVFQSLFGSGGVNQNLGVLRQQRLSVLDVVKKQFDAVVSQLGSDGALKMEAHAALIRNLELRLEASTVPTECVPPPTQPLSAPYYSPSMFAEVSDLQMDLLAAAFSCDLTRIATLQFSYAGSNHVFGAFDPTGEGHHALTHANQTDEVIAARVNIEAWYAAQVASLVDRLKAIPEGDGTLLDSTLIVWLNEMSDPGPHSYDSMPACLIGSLRGTMQTGRVLDVGVRSLNDLHLTVAKAMGLELGSFGEPGHCEGLIDELFS